MTLAARTWQLRFRLRERLERSWIVIPGLYVVGALVLGRVVPSLEGEGVVPFGVTYSQDSALDILQTVAGGMITFTGLVVSVAVLVVQFGAAQYTPRLVLRFRRDPAVKHSLGFFIAPAIFALVSLGHVGDSGDASRVTLTVIVAIGLLVVAVFAFFLLIGSLLDLLRPRRLYDRLRQGCERAIDQVYPDPYAGDTAAAVPDVPPITERVTHHGENGVLSAVDFATLVAHATRAGVCVELVVRVGEYVRHGAPIMHVRGARTAGATHDLARSVIFAEERTLTQDPSYAIRTVVDIAVKALSPAVNDPTTAVQGLDTLEAILHQLAGRDLGTGHLRDAHGNLRVIYPAADWPELLQLTLTEVRHYGVGSHQVARRLRALLLSLTQATAPGRQPALRREFDLLQDAVTAAYTQPGEREIAGVADHTGLGGRTNSGDRPAW